MQKDSQREAFYSDHAEASAVSSADWTTAKCPYCGSKLFEYSNTVTVKIKCRKCKNFALIKS